MRRLTVLGTCGAWPQAGRAASGFLLEYDWFRLVLDLGYATLPRLLTYCEGGDIDAVVITHEHPDHCADLSALGRERYFSDDRRARVPLYCTPGVIGRVQAMEPSEDLLDVFSVYRLPGTHQVGPFQLDAVLLPHHVPHAGVRVTAPGLTVAYSGDAGPDAALAPLGACASLFVIGATLQGPPPDEDPRHLMSATEAGTWATRAGAQRLLLTHFWPDSDRARSVTEAQSTFAGEVIAADEGLIVPL
ncbi:MBL fold metallo-hydrolase [Streptomyces sp. H10-C2]|uniref:MBL fold metallo-hydrolase n=1 Tax=unclassified Streptomyces TaxID=2593676 RepID=UPI0024BA4BEF|nr:MULTISPECIES: MBL fold metallo-hydrolase [unclassified Streptomyces]MDJ0346474.1 MBL fold metallo-hydrolase [Streptomyces sp. PH10-H1]MDJ0374413.1 MBL fold metallo-hydrolase [Streptomyces sp. H10-C2]